MTDERQVGGGQQVEATAGESSVSTAADTELPVERPEWEPIRAWARENGYVVNNRGRVPAAIREAYEQEDGRR